MMVVQRLQGSRPDSPPAGHAISSRASRVRRRASTHAHCVSTCASVADVDRNEILANARWVASTGLVPDAAHIASRMGCDSVAVETVVASDTDLRRHLSALRSIARTVRPPQVGARPPAARSAPSRRPAWNLNVSKAELSARRIYGAEENPAEAEYADIRLPANMAWGGGNQGGHGSLRQ